VAELDPTAIHLAAQCVTIHQSQDQVSARFDGGREIEADLLVGADGVHSVVRAQCFGPTRLAYRGYTSWRGATPPGSVPQVTDSIETWGRGARFGLQPTSGNRILWYATLNAAEGGTDAGRLREMLLGRFGGWHDPIRSVIVATPEDAIVRTDIYDARPSRTWTRGRVALIGDAIHPMTPDLGQGACQAILDATTLADCLAASKHLHVALRAYQHRRARNAAVTTLLARTFGIAGQWEADILCSLRDTILRAMPLSVQLRQLDWIIGRVGPTRRTRVAPIGP
jgi:2-polyprenyl-6-methoxyphenol hydroxylase-like FAD-dependent oxidoreductase